MARWIDEVHLLEKSLRLLGEQFDRLPRIEEEVDVTVAGPILAEIAERLGDNFPYFHPFYLGQMLKPAHPIAKLAYQMALQINPNNHALDGGRASSEMEKEAVADIAKMFGFNQHLGHLTSGGTFANLEALWIAGREHPGKAIAASAQAHYTHGRIADVLGLSFREIPYNSIGRLDLAALEALLREGEVGTVVVTMGTTGFGFVEPLEDVVVLRKTYDFRLHVDAAYGGYFILDEGLESEAARHYSAICNADSIVVDPHKHGLQPYGCGCILFADPLIGRHYKHDSPYTYFVSNDLHLGEISLECSRAGASAVGLYATQKVFPLVKGGVFAARLSCSRLAAQKLCDLVEADKRFLTAWCPDLDIVVWLPSGASATEISERSNRLFLSCAEQDIHLALFEVPTSMISANHPEVLWDQETVTALRACLMKPEHLQSMDEIWKRIDRAAESIQTIGDFHVTQVACSQCKGNCSRNK